MTVSVSTPSDREITMTRAFAAPRSLVFDALTKPELLKRWHGARGWFLVDCEVDLRVGGAWRFVSEGPLGMKMGHSGVYREISPPDRLVYTETFDDQWYPGESLVTVVLVERGGETTMSTTQLFSSQEVRDLVLASPMKRGVSESYERLDVVFTETRLPEGETP